LLSVDIVIEDAPVSIGRDLGRWPEVAVNAGISVVVKTQKTNQNDGDQQKLKHLSEHALWI
jgi:hypothetical protein